MTVKTKKHKKSCGRKTIKKSDVSHIKLINREYQKHLDHKLIKQLVHEFESRIILNYSTIQSTMYKNTYFYSIKQHNNYGTYYYTKNDNTTRKHILVDCQEMAKHSNYFHMNPLDIANDESYVAFSVDYVGNNTTTVYLKHIHTNKLTIITKHGGGGYCLSPDSTILYYVICDTTGKPYKLYAYMIETKTHMLIYTETEESTSIEVNITSDNLFCVLTCSTKTYSNILKLNHLKYDALMKHQTTHLYQVDHFLNKWYILVQDTHSKIIETEDFTHFTTTLKYTKDVTYEYFFIKNNKLIVGTREKGFTHIIIKDLCSNKLIQLKLSPIRYNITFPELANLNVFSDDLNVRVSTFLQPSKIISINLSTLKITELKSYNPYSYRPKQYTEKLIQVHNDLYMTIMYKTSKFKNNMKCLLGGYGAYGIEEDPSFNNSIQSLLDRGFIYCIAHVRGGGFNGTKWYDAGKLLHKKNTFHDFITCTEHLINNHYTTPDRLAIWGRSAGGLLIGATINMRPELYKFAILGVPFVDVLSTMSDECSPLTREEYYEFGNPRKPNIHSYMKSYSPVDNIDTSHNYPNIFIYSNINDNQVRYIEPYRYYNKIKDSSVFQSGEKDILMNINLKYGHSQSSKRFEATHEMATIYSLILKYIQ